MKPDEGSPREGHVPNLLSEKYQEARRLERYISIYVCSVCSTVHQGENNIKWGQNEIGERENRTVFRPNIVMWKEGSQ